jgi:hypothetical protein
MGVKKATPRDGLIRSHRVSSVWGVVNLNSYEASNASNDLDLQFATNKAINSEDVIGQFTKRRTVEAVEIKVFNRTDQAQSCITNI